MISLLLYYYCQKSSEETVANMEKLHSEALAAKEAEISARINKAVVCAKFLDLIFKYNLVNPISKTSMKFSFML